MKGVQAEGTAHVKAQRLGGRQQEACGAAAGWARGARSRGGEVSADHWGAQHSSSADGQREETLRDILE